MPKKKQNFAGWLTHSFNSMMGSIASKMTTNLSNYTSLYNSAGRVVNSTDYLNAVQLDPQLYCDILDTFPYFNALVNVFADACYEIISNDSFQITCNDKQLESTVNKAIKDYKLKDYILKHLHEMFKRGCFTGLISENEITDIITPYKCEFVVKKGKLLSTSLGNAQIPFYDTFTYYYDTRIKNALTVEECKKINQLQKKNDVDQDLDSLWAKIQENISSKYDPVEEKKLLKAFKECIELDTVIIQGKSYFESSLTDIFRIFIRDYIFDALTLSNYMKSNCLTTTIASNKINNESALEVINGIESLLNTDNINILMAYSDPLQLINNINDKLLNRVRVLPQIKDYSEISTLNLPDIDAQLKSLKENIADAKKQIEDDLKIPADIFTGNGNRWELSSKYEEYTNTLTHLLKTVSLSICRFCVSIAYRITGNYYDTSLFEHKFDLNKYISPYQKSSRVSMLKDKIEELTKLLDTVSDAMSNEAVNDVKFIDYVKKELKEADPDLPEILSFMPMKYSQENQNENQDHGFGHGDEDMDNDMFGGASFEDEEKDIENNFEPEPEEEPMEEEENESEEEAGNSATIDDIGSVLLG